MVRLADNDDFGGFRLHGIEAHLKAFSENGSDAIFVADNEVVQPERLDQE